jgi:hypothetical protein
MPLQTRTCFTKTGDSPSFSPNEQKPLAEHSPLIFSPTANFPVPTNSVPAFFNENRSLKSVVGEALSALSDLSVANVHRAPGTSEQLLTTP